MSLQELKYSSIDLLQKYLISLHRRPIVTKSITSAIICGLGDGIHQISNKKDAKQEISLRSIAAFAGTGLIVTGPLTHYFYVFLDRAVPQGSKFSSILRLLIDRLTFAPVYLLLVLYVRSLLEGAGNKGAKRKVFRTYLPILRMSYRLLTIAEFMNVNHVPQQYRIFFSNVIALYWNVHLASMKEGQRRK